MLIYGSEARQGSLRRANIACAASPSDGSAALLSAQPDEPLLSKTVTAMHPSYATYRNQVVRLPDLTVTQDVLSGVTFENCTIIGPAVIALLGGVTLRGCSFDGEAEAVLWPLGARQNVLGAIGLLNCVLVGCRFQRIGLAYTDEQESMLREGGLIP